jgi:hypothetical protein
MLTFKRKVKIQPHFLQPKMVKKNFVQHHIFLVFRYIRKYFAAKLWLMLREMNRRTILLPIVIPDLSPVTESKFRNIDSNSIN